MKHKGQTREQIIDYVLEQRKSYRGIVWTSDESLSRIMGKYDGYVQYCRHVRFMSHKHIIDEFLDGKQEEVCFNAAQQTC